jgi:hypothetical protein
MSKKGKKKRKEYQREGALPSHSLAKVRRSSLVA